MQIINDRSPALAYGCAVGVGDKLYVQGGLQKRNDTASVSRDFYSYDTRTDFWTNLTNPKCPKLSYHDAYVAEKRFIHFVGGWNGKSRTSDVYVYDVRGEKWLDNCATKNFPTGAALSSHTVTQLSDGNALVVGRLGGLKTQRKTSSVFVLKQLDCANFEYAELSSCHVTSRSGHTCNAVSARSALVVGGREDYSVEKICINQQPPLVEEFPADGRGLVFEINNNANATTNWRPRKYHVTLPLTNERLLAFGGESCGGTISSKPFDDCWIYLLKTDAWKKVANLPCPKLTGHKTANFVETGQTYIVGGFDENWLPNKFLYKLVL